MHLTLRQFVAVVPRGAAFYPDLAEAADRFGISTPLDESHWLGQMAVESDRFRSTRENLNYAAEVLPAKFKGRISVEDAARFGRIDKMLGGHKKTIQKANQIEIANRIYGGAWGAANLGNTQPGDGGRFIGRGLKMNTGRDNYRRCSLAIYGDERLLQSPELLEQPDAAALSAGWFWKANKLSALAARDDGKAITCKVTGWRGQGDGAGVSHPQRMAFVAKFKASLGDA